MAEPPYPQQPESQDLLFVDAATSFPDVCVCCGVYTDQRVNLRYRVQEEKVVERQQFNAPLGCLLMFLGPLGFVISGLLSATAKREAFTQTKSVTRKVRVPQCSLCQAEGKVESVSTDEFDRAGLRVCPEFRRQFEQARPN